MEETENYKILLKDIKQDKMRKKILLDRRMIP